MTENIEKITIKRKLYEQNVCPNSAQVFTVILIKRLISQYLLKASEEDGTMCNTIAIQK